MNSHALIRLRESGEDPVVHLAPERTHLRVPGLPILEHLLSRRAKLGFEKEFLALPLRQLRPRSLQRFDLLRKRLVVVDIKLADQVIPLHAGRFRRAAVAEPFIGDHRFADMNAAVIDEVDLNDIVTDPLQQRPQRHAERVVPHMAEMLRLVRVRRGKFDENPPAFALRQPPGLQQPLHIRNRIAVQRPRFQCDVHKCLDRLRLLDIGMLLQERRRLGPQPPSDFRSFSQSGSS